MESGRKNVQRAFKFVNIRVQEVLEVGMVASDLKSYYKVRIQHWTVLLILRAERQGNTRCSFAFIELAV